MTGVSRAGWANRASGRGKALVKWIFGGWHAACFSVLASGCFYLGPWPTLDENVPPSDIEHNFTPNAPLGIGAAGTTVLVLARDADRDPLVFTWFLSNDGFVGDATPVPYGVEGGAGSQVRLAPDPLLDGQTLRCDIDDGVNATVSLEWPLEVYP